MLVNSLVRPLFFDLSYILSMVAFYAKSQIYRIPALASSSLSDFELFSSLVGKVCCGDNMLTTLGIWSAMARTTSSGSSLLLPGHPVLAYPCLPQDVA